MCSTGGERDRLGAVVAEIALMVGLNVGDCVRESG